MTTQEKDAAAPDACKMMAFEAACMNGERQRGFHDDNCRFQDVVALRCYLWRFLEAYLLSLKPSEQQLEQPVESPETHTLIDAMSRSSDYEAVLADHRRLARELDVALNGEEGAAQQASLCDIVGQVKAMMREASTHQPAPLAEVERVKEQGVFDKWASDTGFDPHQHSTFVREAAWRAWQARAALSHPLTPTEREDAEFEVYRTVWWSYCCNAKDIELRQADRWILGVMERFINEREGTMTREHSWDEITAYYGLPLAQEGK